MEAVWSVGPVCAEGLCVTVGGSDLGHPAVNGPCSDLASVPALFSGSSLRDYVQYWAERGVEVVGWTVNSAVEKDYYHTLLKSGYSTDSLLEDCDYYY